MTGLFIALWAYMSVVTGYHTLKILGGKEWGKAAYAGLLWPLFLTFYFSGINQEIDGDV